MEEKPARRVERFISWSAIGEQVTDVLIVTKRDELRMSQVVFLKTAHKEWKAKYDGFPYGISILLVRDHQSTLLYASDRDISTMCDWMIVQER
jgi:hypothetical protein